MQSKASSMSKKITPDVSFMLSSEFRQEVYKELSKSILDSCLSSTNHFIYTCTKTHQNVNYDTYLPTSVTMGLTSVTNAKH